MNIQKMADNKFESPNQRLATLVSDEVITREFSDAVLECMSEIGSIEESWNSIKNCQQTSRWWYCAIKHFYSFAQEQCDDFLCDGYGNYATLTYLSIVLRDLDTDINIKKAIELYPCIMSNSAMIKKLLLAAPDDDTLYLLNNNTCTELEKKDIWKFAISVSAVYILYAPPEISNSKSTRLQLKLKLFIRYECDIKWTEKASDSLFMDLINVVSSRHEELPIDRLMLMLELDTINAINYLYEHNILKNEIFLNRVSNGCIKPNNYLCELLLRRKSDIITNIDYFMENSNIAHFDGAVFDGPNEEEIFMKYPTVIYKIPCDKLRKLYKKIKKQNVPLFRRNIAIIHKYSENMCDIRRVGTIESLYKSLFGNEISINDEYTAYKQNYVDTYEEKYFRSDIVARYNPDICRHVTEINKENIFYVRSADPLFCNHFFNKHPDMLLRKEICWSYMIETICISLHGYIKQPLIMFNIMNGVINITELPKARYDQVIEALCEVVDRYTKNALHMNQILESLSHRSEKRKCIRNNIDKFIFGE